MIEYSSKSTRTHLEAFARHSLEYMVEHGEWEVCTRTPALPVLPSQLLSNPQSKELLGVPVTQLMVDLLCAILHSTANQVVRMLPAHYEQFGTFQTTMSEGDRAVLHITDVKAIQQKINSLPREKARYSTAEDKVLAGQTAIKNGTVMAIINLAAFNAKAAITSVIQQVKNAEQVHTVETSTQGLARCLHKARQSLEDGWADTQTVLFTNTGVKHAAIAMADVGARAVHAGLRTLRAQAQRVGTGAHGRSPSPALASSGAIWARLW